MSERRISAAGRGAGRGACIAGAVGGMTGLALGLRANPRTAWFAVGELGVPAAAVGAVIGFVVALIGTATRRTNRS